MEAKVGKIVANTRPYDQQSELSLEDRVKKADQEYHRFLNLGGTLTEEFDEVIFSRFGLTPENGGLDAFIRYQRDQRVRLDQELANIKAEQKNLQE